jgi:phage FluMu protein Com
MRKESGRERGGYEQWTERINGRTVLFIHCPRCNRVVHIAKPERAQEYRAEHSRKCQARRTA